MLPSSGRFPITRPSLLDAIRCDDVPQRRLGWERLVEAYWKPVYKYLRLQWRVDAEQARDWTQEFFARAMEKEFFERFDAGRARFRTFLRVCVDGFVGKERQAAARLKRGGGVAPLSLDFAAAEGELAGVEPPAPDRLDDLFHREWMRSLFESSLAELQRSCAAEGKEAWFRLLQRYDLEAPARTEKLTYADLAQEMAMPVTQVTNGLHWARTRLRSCLLARLRELTVDDDDYRAEARALLGVDPA